MKKNESISSKFNSLTLSGEKNTLEDRPERLDPTQVTPAPNNENPYQQMPDDNVEIVGMISNPCIPNLFYTHEVSQTNNTVHQEREIEPPTCATSWPFNLMNSEVTNNNTEQVMNEAGLENMNDDPEQLDPVQLAPAPVADTSYEEVFANNNNEVAGTRLAYLFPLLVHLNELFQNTVTIPAIPQETVDMFLNCSIFDLCNHLSPQNVSDIMNWIIDMSKKERNLNRRWGPLTILFTWMNEIRSSDYENYGINIFPTECLLNYLHELLAESELSPDTTLDDEEKSQIYTVIKILESWLERWKYNHHNQI